MLLENSFWKKIHDAIAEATKAWVPYFEVLHVGLEKIWLKNCGRWSDNVIVTLPDSISSKEVDFEKILSFNVDILEILIGKNIKSNTKLQLRVSINLLNLRFHILISQC